MKCNKDQPEHICIDRKLFIRLICQSQDQNRPVGELVEEYIKPKLDEKLDIEAARAKGDS